MGAFHLHIGAWRADRRGTALIEFALVAPVFLAMLSGLAGYGGYFWRAHSLQQTANDAARAALPGLTAPEREALARSAVTTDLAALGFDKNRTTTSVSESGELVIVGIVYDGSRDAFLNLSMIPLPSKIIRRMAAVRLGGL